MSATTEGRRRTAARANQSQPQDGSDTLLSNKPASSSSSLTAPPLLLTILVATSLLGTVYAYLYSDPAHTSFRSRLPASTLSDHLKTTSLFPSTLPYFADKRNLFNQLFVKRGWFWTSLVWLAYVLATFFFPPARSTRDAILIQTDRVPLLVRQLRRWTIATAFWWFLTQGTWFVGVGSGPSVHQRHLIATGAQCVPAAISSTSLAANLAANNNLENGIVQPMQCVGARGEFYTGGHDVSGHTFMLIHASLLLWETVKPTIISLPIFRQSFPTNTTSPSSSSSVPLAPSPLAVYTAFVALALVALWEWMLLMTSIYFHTPQEKVSGLIFGVAGWWLSSL